MAAEHLLNEYCTPEYSAPQLIAAITSLPAPVMDDAACDMWSLGVVMFQLLASTVLGPQVVSCTKEKKILQLSASIWAAWGCTRLPKL